MEQRSSRQGFGMLAAAAVLPLRTFWVVVHVCIVSLKPPTGTDRVGVFHFEAGQAEA